MSPANVIVVGAGKRVLETALPAFQRAEDAFSVQRVFARRERRIRAGDRDYEVRAFDRLTRTELEGASLTYVAVAKDAVPSVLARLAESAPPELDLLLDTPVVRFKHFHHVRRLRRFRSVWVAEDCSRLPWLDTVRQAVERGLVGRLERVLFLQSAYAYHAVATAKALVGSSRVVYGRRRRLAGRFGTRELRFANRTRALVLEPRDYPSGRLLLLGPKGSIGDYASGAEGHHHLEPVVTGGRCRGFRVGEVETQLTDDESSLTSAGPDGASVTARMEDVKRVGFLRLLRDVHAGRGAYPLGEALDDMVVDYHLEKLGAYAANPFTSARSGLARGLLGGLTRVGGG